MPKLMRCILVIIRNSGILPEFRRMKEERPFAHLGANLGTEIKIKIKIEIENCTVRGIIMRLGYI